MSFGMLFFFSPFISNSTISSMMFEVMDIKKSFEAADRNHDKSISASGKYFL